MEGEEMSEENVATEAQTEEKTDATPEQAPVEKQVQEPSADSKEVEGGEPGKPVEEAPKEQPPVEYKLPEKFPYPDIVDVAKKHNISPEGLDDFIKFQSAKNLEAHKTFQAHQAKEVEALQQEWGDEFKANVAAANRVISHFDGEDKALVKFLQATGGANNPTVIKFLHKIGAALIEDGFLTSESTPTREAKKSAAQTLYPTMDKNKEGD